MKLRVSLLGSYVVVPSLLLSLVLAACGDDDLVTPPEVDAGGDDANVSDAGPDTDAGPPDANLDDAGPQLDATSPDAEVDDAGFELDAAGTDASAADAAVDSGSDVDSAVCSDGDGDGYTAATCGGDDCDDTRGTVNPGAAEVCNAGRDDDCNGLADAADGVCAPCPAGYRGTDADCINVNECVEVPPCGGGSAACTDTTGSYVCGCRVGYTAPPSGGTCTDVDECGTGTPCGITATSCTNTLGSYICACAPGYGAPVFGGSCIDLDECMAGTCGAGSTGCTNSSGSYACSCGAGYTTPPPGAPCRDVNECATGTPCGATGVACANTDGSYVCTCSTGYAAPATGGPCADANECALGTDDCDRDPPGVCANTVGSFTCICPVGLIGTGRGATGCLLTDPSLLSLVPSNGALSPAFYATTTMYTLGAAPGAASVTLTPSVAYPGNATIRVNGAVVASGAPSAPIALTGFAVTPVSVTVTTDSGAMRVYTVVVGRGSTYVKASNTGANDYFGTRLALSADGTTLAVGASTEDSNATGIGGVETNNATLEAGAVYVFTRVGSTWSQQAYVKASNTGVNDQFGYAVALSDDGSTMAVGAVSEGSNATGIDGDQANNTAPGSGAVYVFTRAGSTWSQQAYVKASNAVGYFGCAVALAADGATLAVGARYEDSNATGIDGDQANTAAPDAGAAYVFVRVGTAWSQQAYVKASNARLNNNFGYTVAVSADGAMLAVGAPYESSNATGIDGDQTNTLAGASGAVYVFHRIGSTWAQQAYVKPSNTATSFYFGTALALSRDASTLAVGAYNEPSNATGIGGDQTNSAAPRAGAAYVFARVGTTWAQQAYVKGSNTEMSDGFGFSIALSSDGSTLVVGADNESSASVGIGGGQGNTGSGVGAAYVFSRMGSTWSQIAYVKASTTGTSDYFGRALALSADGLTLAVAAQYEDSNATGIGGNQTNNAATNAGAVFVY